VSLLRLVAPLTSFIPGIPSIESDEIRRLSEDKAFDIMPMFNRLGVHPIALADGLTQTFGLVNPDSNFGRF